VGIVIDRACPFANDEAVGRIVRSLALEERIFRQPGGFPDRAFPAQPLIDGIIEPDRIVLSVEIGDRADVGVLLEVSLPALVSVGVVAARETMRPSFSSIV
jgi:hypothetical protein